MADAYELGMMGLGVMGRNLALNMSDHGFAVAGYDPGKDKVQAFNQDAQGYASQAFDNLKDFLGHLKKPRMIMMLIPAGAVDNGIQELLPYLEKGDILIDGGNSHFTDTDERAQCLHARGVQFLGVGVSGGESGARNGPSIMPGGPPSAYEKVRPIFEAIAAKVRNEPCVAYMGAGSAGHYVKMVHNGIEYGLMQLIAESYDLMKSGLRLSNRELGAVYGHWSRTGLNGFLMEITAEIFQQKDPVSGADMLDRILDVAKQKGTGVWASQDAMNLGVPVPTLDIAVAMRDLSVFKKDREALNCQLASPQEPFHGDRQAMIQQLGQALEASMMLTYAQGMSLLHAASKAYKHNLNLSAVAKIWRGGCIIRSALLESIASAYEHNPDLQTLLLDAYFQKEMLSRQQSLRHIVMTGLQLNIPVSAFAVTLSYYDAYRRSWLPANLIQAQRDFFGAHTYERIDEAGAFHTEWGQTLREQAYVH